MTSSTDTPIHQNKGLTDRLDINFALKAARLGVWELDPITSELRWDDRCRELFGLASDNPLSYEQAIQYIHPDDVNRVKTAVQWAMNLPSGGDYDVTYRTIGADDGALRWVRFMGQAEFTANGAVSRFAGVAQDVTKDEQARQSQETADLLQAIFNSSSAGISVLGSVRDEQGDIIDFDYRLVNRVTEQMNNRTDLVGNLYSVIHPAYRKTGIFDDLKEVVQTGRIIECERHYTGEGFDNWYDTVAVKLDDGVVFSFRDITPMVKAREEVMRFKYMADNASDPFILMRQDGTFAYLNKLALDRWGYTADEAAHIRVPDVDPIYNDEVFRASFTKAQTEAILPFETLHQRKDGVIYPVEVNMGGLMLGDQPHLFAVARDNRERKQAEESLKASEQRFQAAIAAVEGILWTNNAQGEMEGEQPGWAALTGQTYEEYQGYGWSKAVHPDDAQPTVDAWQDALAQRSMFIFEHRVQLKNGQWGLFSIRAIPLLNTDGSVREWVGVHTDITEQRNAQQYLAESEAKLRSVIANAPIAIGLFVGRDLVVEMPNQAFIDIVGKGPDIVGKPLREVMPELESQPFLQILDDVYTSGQMFQSFGSQVDIMRQGVMTHNFYNITYSPLFDSEGKVYAILDIAIDVTERIVAHQKIEESRQQLLASFEQSPVGIAIIGEDNLTFRMANPFYGELTGRTPDQLIGKPLLEAMPEIRGQGFDLLLNEVLATGIPYIAKEVPAHVLRNNQLETIYVDLTYQPQYDTKPDTDRNHVSSVLVVATDVTQQVMTRQEIEESEKEYRTLSAELDKQVQARTQQLQTSVQDLVRSNQNLQQFAYVASHDLQEPLRKIQSFGDMLRNQYSNQLGESGVDFLNRMQNSATRMSTLIRDLLTYSRISTQKDTSIPVSLRRVIEMVLTDFDLKIQETGATIKVDSLPTVQGDPSQLGQLFQNLISNALKFRKAGESPQISLTCQTVAAIDLPPTVRPTRVATTYYRIDVSDKGIGFNQQHVERIFQVFQRLHGKAQFAGTGIGLAICEKVVANHGGAITAHSKPGEGATFSVYLPE